MKRTICLTIGMLTLASMPALAQAACSTKTIKGKYGYTMQGLLVTQDNKTHHLATAGVIKFDGKGNFTEFETTSSAEDGVMAHKDHVGTYTMNPNCTGIATSSTNKTVYFVTGPNGKVVKFMGLFEGLAATGEGMRIPNM